MPVGPEARGMSPQRLFSYVIALASITCMLVLMVQLYSGEVKVFLPTLLTGIVLISVYIIHGARYKYLSYFLFLSCMNGLNIYMVVFDNNNFQAIYAIYIVGLVFTFIYFRRINILLVFMFFSLISQALILYYNSDADLNGITAYLIVDGMCLLSVNCAVFLMCYFYLSNLEKAKVNLELTAQDLEKQRVELKERSNQLSKYIESNIQLENYTHLAAHELKAPLKAVKGFADILKDKVAKKLDDKEKKMFSFISDKTDKMNTLLNDLSSLGKVSQSKLTNECIDLDDLFRDILIDRNDLIASNRAIMDFELSVTTMVGQYGLIKQLFSNLIGNALKFVDDSKRSRVLVTGKEVGDELVFKVMDNGIGIKPEHRNRIFQIFERLHAEAEFKGSGIGLSISKKIVDLHQGTISVEDSEFGGACFVVRIPKLTM